MKHWLLAISMALNQLANAILGGDPDMAFSARVGYARLRGSRTGTIACFLLELIDPHVVNDGRPAWAKLPGDHCDIAVINDRNRTP